MSPAGALVARERRDRPAVDRCRIIDRVSTPRTADRVRALTGFLDGWLSFQRWYRQVPALAVGVAVGDETVHTGAWGRADVERDLAATTDTRFRIASHSKVFTATALVQLVEAGRMRLDDRVVDHLGDLADAAGPDGDLAHVTVRHLLSHASGITRDGSTTHWHDDRFPTRAEIVAQVGELPVLGTVEALKYSNVALTLAAQVVEAVTGASYEEHVTETILRPLGLTATTPDLPDDLTDHAVGYPRWLPDRERPPFDHVRAGAMNGATGFSSNVPDLLRWYRAHRYGSGELLHDRWKREMQRVQFEGRDLRWGLGFRLATHGGMRFATHGGGYPGFITYSGVEQDHGIAIAVLTNAADGPAEVWFDGIATLIARALSGDFDGDPPIDAGVADRLAGFYEHRWGLTQVARIGSRIVTASPTMADPTAGLAVLEHVDGLEFRSPDTFPVASPGEAVRFEDGDPPVLRTPASPPVPRSADLVPS